MNQSRQKTEQNDKDSRSNANNNGGTSVSMPAVSPIQQQKESIEKPGAAQVEMNNPAGGSTLNWPLQLKRDIPEEEKIPFHQLAGKRDSFEAHYQSNLNSGFSNLQKYIVQDDHAVVAPEGKFEGTWNVQKSKAGKGRTQYEITHKNKALVNEGQKLHYKNILAVAENGTVTIEALSNYGPTREMRLAQTPGCSTFLSDAWQLMLNDYNVENGADIRIDKIKRSHIENPATLATIMQCTDYRFGKFMVNSAMDRIALLGSPNGIGYVQMMINNPEGINLQALVANQQFTIAIDVYGPPMAAMADMVIG